MESPTPAHRPGPPEDPAPLGHLRDRRIWVTGAGGFVGSHLVPRLRAAGAEVIPTDHDVDVRQPAPLAAALRRLRPDAVVHLAALSSVAASVREARTTWEVNYLGARNLLAAAAQNAADRALPLRSSPLRSLPLRILLVGSGAVYGSSAPGAPPFDESAPLRPGSPYAWAKACADLLGARYAERAARAGGATGGARADHAGGGQPTGLAVVRVRPFNHTGPGQSDVFVASSFARQIAEIEAGRREPVLRVGNLDSVRDFLPVEDVIEAYLRLLDPAVPPAAYNLASGRGLRIGDLLERLLAHARTEVRQRVRVEMDARRWRETDVSVGSAERLRKAAGWAPRPAARVLDESLARLLESWRDQVRRNRYQPGRSR